VIPGPRLVCRHRMMQRDQQDGSSRLCVLFRGGMMGGRAGLRKAMCCVGRKWMYVVDEVVRFYFL
jgi:hypothetical protein